MKKLLCIAMLIILSGCVSSNPELTIVNQQKLIGTWGLHYYEVDNRKIPPEENERLVVVFTDAGGMAVFTKQNLNSDLIFKQAITGDKITVMTFKDGVNKATITSKFKVDGTYAYFTNLKLKTSYAGTINFQAMMPDIDFDKMTLVFKKIPLT